MSHFLSSIFLIRLSPIPQLNREPAWKSNHGCQQFSTVCIIRALCEVNPDSLLRLTAWASTSVHRPPVLHLPCKQEGVMTSLVLLLLYSFRTLSRKKDPILPIYFPPRRFLTPPYLCPRKTPNRLYFLCSPGFVDQATTVTYLKGFLCNMDSIWTKLQPFPEKIVRTFKVPTRTMSKSFLAHTSPPLLNSLILTHSPYQTGSRRSVKRIRIWNTIY